MTGPTLRPHGPDDALDASRPLTVLRALLDEAPSGFGLPTRERDTIDAAGGKGAAIYGELEDEAALRLLRALSLGPDDVFVDLGSGTGRIPLLAACGTDVGRSLGIELATPRHAAARQLRERLLASLTWDARARLAPRIDFRHGDLRHHDLSQATVVYAGATCFPDQLMVALCRQVEATAPRLRRLVSTRPLPAPFDRSFPPVAELDLPASWSPKVRVHVHTAPTASRSTSAGS